MLRFATLVVLEPTITATLVAALTVRRHEEVLASLADAKSASLALEYCAFATDVVSKRLKKQNRCVYLPCSWAQAVYV